jgi:hypothetical protein
MLKSFIFHPDYLGVKLTVFFEPSKSQDDFIDGRTRREIPTSQDRLRQSMDERVRRRAQAGYLIKARCKILFSNTFFNRVEFKKKTI